MGVTVPNDSGVPRNQRRATVSPHKHNTQAQQRARHGESHHHRYGGNGPKGRQRDDKRMERIRPVRVFRRRGRRDARQSDHK